MKGIIAANFGDGYELYNDVTRLRLGKSGTQKKKYQLIGDSNGFVAACTDHGDSVTEWKPASGTSWDLGNAEPPPPELETMVRCVTVWSAEPVLMRVRRHATGEWVEFWLRNGDTLAMSGVSSLEGSGYSHQVLVVEHVERVAVRVVTTYRKK